MFLYAIRQYSKIAALTGVLYLYFSGYAIASDLKKINPVWNSEIVVKNDWDVVGTSYLPDGDFLLAGTPRVVSQKMQSDLHLLDSKGMLVKQTQLNGQLVYMLNVNAGAVAVIKNSNSEFKFVTFNPKLEIVDSRPGFSGDFQVVKVLSEAGSSEYIIFVMRNGIPKILRLKKDLSVEIIFSGAVNESFSDAEFCQARRLCVLKYSEVDKLSKKPGKLELISIALDSLKVDSKYLANGKKASIDVSPSGDMAILYDVGELTKQHIIVQSLDKSFKSKWTIDLLDSPFGIESYKVSYYKDGWIIVGSYLNKIFLNKLSEKGEKVSEFMSKNGYPLIMTDLFCRSEFGCVVNAQQIAVDNNMKKTTKLQLLQFKE